MRNAWTHRLAAGAIAALIGSALGAAGAAAAGPSLTLVVRSVDGSGNNAQHPTWGKAGLAYRRVAPRQLRRRQEQQVTPAKPRPLRQQPDLQRRRPEPVLRERHLAVGVGVGPVHRPRHRAPRRDARRSRADAVRPGRPARAFTQRPRRDRLHPHAGGAGTGVDARRASRSTRSVSYIDASKVYGSTRRAARLAARRRRRSSTARLPGRTTCRAPRGNARTRRRWTSWAPLAGHRAGAVVAGDVRANENIALTAIQTLFAREHNRIVAAAAGVAVRQELKFQIARRVVGAEIEYITYNEFLPDAGRQARRRTAATTRRRTRASRTSSRRSASARTAWSTASSSRRVPAGTYSRSAARHVVRGRAGSRSSTTPTAR